MLNDMISTETMIAFQRDNFLDKLTTVFERYKEGKTNEKQFTEEYSAAMRNRFNLNIKLLVNREDHDVNACALPPALQTDHTLYSSWLDEEGIDDWVRNYVLKDIAKFNKGHLKKIVNGEVDITGRMDYKNARVSGIWSQIEIINEITDGMEKWLKGGKIAPRDLAAIMLHEIGHVWTFMSFSGVYQLRNAILNCTAKEFMECDSDEELFEIVAVTKDVWGLAIDPEQFRGSNKENVTQVVVGAVSRQFLTDVGYTRYDFNTSEVLADQFAMRMGVGPEIAQALWGMMGNSDRFGTSAKTWNVIFGLGMAGLIGGIALVIAGAFMGAVVALWMSVCMMISPVKEVKEQAGWLYDYDKDRFIRQRNELVKSLKQQNLPVKVLKASLASIKTIDGIIAQMKDYSHIGTWFAKLFKTKAYGQLERKMYQNLMEELAANKLYEASAKFKTLDMD